MNIIIRFICKYSLLFKQSHIFPFQYTHKTSNLIHNDCYNKNSPTLPPMTIETIPPRSSPTHTDTQPSKLGTRNTQILQQAARAEDISAREHDSPFRFSTFLVLLHPPPHTFASSRGACRHIRTRAYTAETLLFLLRWATETERILYAAARRGAFAPARKTHLSRLRGCDMTIVLE